MVVERFVFPGETSSLSESEFATALRCLDWISETMVERKRRQESQGAAFAVHMPSAVWSPSERQNFERDSAVTNPFTSFDLVMTRDFNVVRQLRLYSQAFTGYQLATLEMAHKRPWIRTPLPANFDDFVAMLVFMPEIGIELYGKLASKMPPHLLIRPPHKFGELGWLIDGCIGSYDTFHYLQRIALNHEIGLLDGLAEIAKQRRPRVLEIGGGFGALAHHLSMLNPSIEFTIVDIPESLAFSSVYLSVLHSDATIDLVRPGRELLQDTSFRLCPNFMMDEVLLDGSSYDLVINHTSLNEMMPEQVEYYGLRIAQIIGSDGLFYEQNAEGNKYGLQSLKSILHRHFSRSHIHSSTLVGPDMLLGPAYLWAR